MSAARGLVHRLLLLVLAIVTLLGASASLSWAQEGQGTGTDTGPVIDILPLEGFIDPPVAGAIADLIRDAEERGSELVVLQLDSAGGVSTDVAELAAVMLGADVPVAVFVGPFGAGAEVRGAAALLGLAADVLAVAPDATLGPLLPVDYADADEAVPFPVPPPTPLLDGAFGPEQLEELGIEVLEVGGLEPLLVELDGRTIGDTEVRTLGEDVVPRLHSLGLIARMLHAATTPVFIYLLLTVGLALLLFEVFQPGFGVAGIAGLITAAIGVFGLSVLPVTWWAVALVVLGLVLYGVDVAIAGLGPVTLAATTSFAVGSWAFYDHPALALPGWIVALTTVAALVFFVVVMTTVLRAQAGPETEAVAELVGRVGMVRSVLNPEGHVYIDGALWRARWTGEGRKAKVGTPVRVEGIEGPLVLVDRFDPEAARR